MRTGRFPGLQWRSDSLTKVTLQKLSAVRSESRPKDGSETGKLSLCPKSPYPNEFAKLDCDALSPRENTPTGVCEMRSDQPDVPFALSILSRRILKDSLRDNQQRDTAFRQVILSIPKGKVSSYGKTAAAAERDAGIRQSSAG